MTNRRIDTMRPASIIAGALLNLAITPCAFAASFDGMPAGRDMLLLGSVALLVVGVALRFATRRRGVEPLPPAHDLRWWKNPES